MKSILFLVNYAYYATLFITKKLGKGALGVSERIIGISVISTGEKSLDLLQI
jgi:hypothetical protein